MLDNTKIKYDLIFKSWITKKDIETLLDSDEGSKQTIEKIYSSIRKSASASLEKEGKILPKSSVPANYVWDYVKSYGVTKKSIIENYKLELSLAKV